MSGIRCFICDQNLTGPMFICYCDSASFRYQQGFPRLVSSPQSNFSGNYDSQWHGNVQEANYGSNFRTPDFWQSPDNIQFGNNYNQTPQNFTYPQQNQMGSNVPTNIVEQGFDPYRSQHPQTARTFPLVCVSSMQSPCYCPGSRNVAQNVEQESQSFSHGNFTGPETSNYAQQATNVQNQYQSQPPQASENSVTLDQRLNTQTRNPVQSNLPSIYIQAPILSYDMFPIPVGEPAFQLYYPALGFEIWDSNNWPHPAAPIIDIQEGASMRYTSRASASNGVSNSSDQPNVSTKASSTDKNEKLSELLGSDNKDEEETKTLLICSICLDSAILNNPSITKCGHVFCGECIKNALRIKKKCPVCQKEIELEDVIVMYI